MSFFDTWKRINMLGYQDPTHGVDKYLDRIPGEMRPYYEPYSQAGQRELGGLEHEYGQLTEHPDELINRLGAGYKQSPGFQFALNQALGAGNRSAAAGGMAGSPMSQQWAMDTASGLASRDYGDYISRAMGAYGTGLEGRRDIMERGYGAGSDFAHTMGNLDLTRAGMKFGANQQQNQFIASLLGAIAQGGGTYMGYKALQQPNAANSAAPR